MNRVFDPERGNTICSSKRSSLRQSDKRDGGLPLTHRRRYNCPTRQPLRPTIGLSVSAVDEEVLGKLRDLSIIGSRNCSNDNVSLCISGLGRKHCEDTVCYNLISNGYHGSHRDQQRGDERYINRSVLHGKGLMVDKKAGDQPTKKKLSQNRTDVKNSTKMDTNVSVDLPRTKQTAPSYVTSTKQTTPPYVTRTKQTTPSYVTRTKQTTPPYVTRTKQTTPSYVTSTKQTTPPYVTRTKQTTPSYVTRTKQTTPSYVTRTKQTTPPYVTRTKQTTPSYVTSTKQTTPPNVTVKNLITNRLLTDTLIKAANEEISCGKRCTGSFMTTLNSSPGTRKNEEIISRAEEFIDQYYASVKSQDSPEHRARLKEIVSSVESTGTYHLSYEELVYGAKHAWRNAPRCIGRIQWSKLQVFDARDARTTREMFTAVCRHLTYASNNGNIRSAITVFRQRIGNEACDFRIHNKQIIAYAGYRQPDGTIRGDPANADFTAFCQSLGWNGKNGRFDVLPIVVQADGQDPEWFALPPEIIMEVNIVHPNLYVVCWSAFRYPAFADLGLKWFGVPVISGMMLDCGGIQFTACPFSGWYMSTEIACRDFCDEQRYNLIEDIADNLGLDKSSNITLWRDRSLLETNVAVLHSFQLSGVTISDHHTASESFMTFMVNEHRQRGGCPADWIWIVPPMSSSLCPVFHQEMALYKLKPSFEYQDEIWKKYARRKDQEMRGSRRKWSFYTIARLALFVSSLMVKVIGTRIKCTVLFATETGRSEKFATTLYKIFNQTFNARIITMDKYSIADLPKEQLVLFVTSTFGNGHPPENGKAFAHSLNTERYRTQAKSDQRMPHGSENSIDNNIKHQILHELTDVKFAVFGLGSRAYPNFCAFAHYLDDQMYSLGAKRVFSLGEGDELGGQEKVFKVWTKNVYTASCRSYSLKDYTEQTGIEVMLNESDVIWKPDRFRIVPVSTPTSISLPKELKRIHRKDVMTCRLKDRTRFEMSSGRLTILATIETKDRASLLDYNPGDHVLLFPSNPSNLVDQLLQCVQYAASSQYKVEQLIVHKDGDKNDNVEFWEEYSRLPHCTLREILTSYVDITTPPTQHFLHDLSDMATSAEDKLRLKELASTFNVYDEWKVTTRLTFVDVIRQFPSIQLPAAYLVVRLPLLQPRYYSISSSMEASPGEIHVTAQVIKYQTPDGQTHKGICSNWLNEIEIGEDILCAVKPAPLFHMPRDKAAPIIMVGPGTGIAPFRSFWMQRKFDIDKRAGNYGPMTMYVGCRNSTTDNYYKEELQQCEADGVLTKCYYAYSRENGVNKTYVQDLLKENGKEVYQLLVTDHGHFYICGNIQMASDVKTTLLHVIREHGNMTDEEGDQYLRKMAVEDRLHEDIFGVALRP